MVARRYRVVPENFKRDGSLKQKKEKENGIEKV